MKLHLDIVLLVLFIEANVPVTLLLVRLCIFVVVKFDPVVLFVIANELKLLSLTKAITINVIPIMKKWFTINVKANVL